MSAQDVLDEIHAFEGGDSNTRRSLQEAESILVNALDRFPPGSPEVAIAAAWAASTLAVERREQSGEPIEAEECLKL